MSPGSLGFGLLAGVLSILSPCVLPLVPLVLGPAATAHRFGMPALVAGLVASFVGVGLFVATIGFALGLDAERVRLGASVLLGGAGLVLLSAGLQRRFALATGRFANGAGSLAARLAPTGLAGQFAVGALLGAVWSPCAGPTLGAASLLAAQGRNLFSSAAVMAAFGLGAALPLLGLGCVSREAFLRWRGRLMGVGQGGRRMLGGAALLVAALILSGADHRLETLLVAVSPAWLTDVTTRF